MRKYANPLDFCEEVPAVSSSRWLCQCLCESHPALISIASRMKIEATEVILIHNWK